MSLSTVVQRQAHPARCIRRHVSSKASSVPSYRTLPSVKMRALISLYHQADTFITPENLSQRIDDAFVPQKPDSRLDRRNVTLKDLKGVLDAQRKAPRVSDWDQEAVVSRQYSDAAEMGQWSSLKTSRELKVIEALYGVDTTHPRKILPGLDVVLEESKKSD
ncbi:hypothetical protein BDZ94DRAFT_554390 [Collybia nuda]|uniref:Uncharacterized protein n=1 Tax=Collybia nuda TaxID=64659 RepID=A0A9P5YJF7_9AGAR|nr:hypothetical protein BDZ94DRAFT_554390 [Collybia nuda]